MTALATTAAAALTLGTLYAILYYWMEIKEPDHGQTPWAVVIGVTFVGMLYFALLYTWTGLDTALRHISALFLLFLMAGIPMIIGYYLMRYWIKRSIRLE